VYPFQDSIIAWERREMQELQRMFGSLKHKWEDNIKLYLKEAEYENVN
jgi:hypothetical protein